MSKVLVTGGSGFVGSHALLALLEAGHEVRATVRQPAREAQARALLAGAGLAPGAALSFVVADLERDAGWAEAAEGCEYVLHVASPFPEQLPRHESELIGPAREGTLRVLRAARDAGVRRVVLTSSFAAVGYGHAPPPAVYDETFWTEPEAPGVLPYAKSKTLAERAAWRFVREEGGELELAVVNPAGVFGPVLGADYSTSVLIVQRLLAGQIPGCPKITFGAVDVRDVVDLHLRAMLHPAALGQRFLAVAGSFLTMVEVARALKRRLGAAARRVPTWELPDALVKVAALFDPAVKQIFPELGVPRNATADKARRLLGWEPRPAEEAVVATAESLLRLGLVKR